MTGGLDAAVLAERSAAVQRHLRRMRERLPDRPEQLRPMEDATDVVVLHLWQAVQVAIDVAVSACVGLGLGSPPSYADAFRMLGEHAIIDRELAGRLAQAAGFRNVVVHAYASLDLARVPDAGFVTGGGWIDSPAGAYAADPTMTAKANFGFVSRYKEGATVPDGQTQFQFHAAGLDFHSTVYEWLVVSGPKAQYKGSGTINGAGNYGFMLTANDGQVNGGGGVDKFRIKIWDKGTGTVVYDNQVGDADDAAASDAIEGGSIVIHTGGKK